VSATDEASARLVDATQDRALEVLGFREDDRADVQRAVAAALEDGDRLAEIATLMERLRANTGTIDRADPGPLDVPAARSDWRGIGVLPMLALLATADDVRAYHRSRGIPEAVSDRSLGDIGQQAWVHRRTYGAFGLHTYEWVSVAWSGNLYWLGRLQYEFVRHDGALALSTHIPETGPLAPDAVDDSFAQATAFFDTHFGDRPTSRFHCSSWLLDPQLREVLDPESNMVRFQQRWTLEGEGTVADEDAIFFVFRKRGRIDRAALPRDSTLQRAILDRLDAGGHWNSWNGTIDQGPWR
jgi:hypothetical protein